MSRFLLFLHAIVEDITNNKRDMQTQSIGYMNIPVTEKREERRYPGALLSDSRDSGYC